MATRIEAVYQDGVFHPTEPVNIADGERVQLVLLFTEDVAQAQSPADILADIAALPLESDAEESAARDHDRYLYGSHRP
jgi:predicted DNA-binding antitoxin AbrB/MazE fold protein